QGLPRPYSSLAQGYLYEAPACEYNTGRSEPKSPSLSTCCQRPPSRALRRAWIADAPGGAVHPPAATVRKVGGPEAKFRPMSARRDMQFKESRGSAYNPALAADPEAGRSLRFRPHRSAWGECYASLPIFFACDK